MYYLRTSCHFARFTLNSNLSPTHVSPFPWFHTLCFSESLVVNYINYNRTSSSSSSAVAEPHVDNGVDVSLALSLPPLRSTEPTGGVIFHPPYDDDDDDDDDVATGYEVTLARPL